VAKLPVPLPEMEFLDIYLTKDSRLCSILAVLKKTILFSRNKKI
jgi:hypothetical protein